MSVAVEALFTTAPGLRPPWVVKSVKLDTAKRRIDFAIGCQSKALAYPACGVATQPAHDRLRRSWQHFGFLQFEAWLHCYAPRVACSACGKTTQVGVPWARPGSGFTAASAVLEVTL
jgi:transposase